MNKLKFDIESLPLHTNQELSDRAIFRLSGHDALSYLNGQVTQDVRLAKKGEIIYSFICNHKGKIEGDCYIRTYRDEDAYYIDTSACQRESLFARLDKYLIADDATLEDVSEDYYITFSLDREASHLPNITRYGITGKEIFFKKGELIAPPTQGPQLWKKARVMNKIPEWGAELSCEILPADTGVEELAISFTKGCYTGQEVISRMKSSGKTNRHLVNFETTQKLKTPTDLFHNTEDTKPGATLTSIVADEDGSYIGLGYRTRKSEASTEFVTREGTPVKVI